MKFVLVVLFAVIVGGFAYEVQKPHFTDLNPTESYMTLLNKVEQNIRKIYRNVTHTNVDINRDNWLVTISVDWEDGRIFGAGFASSQKNAKNLAAFNALMNAWSTWESYYNDEAGNFV